MFSFRKVSSTAVIALLMTALLPTWSTAKEAKDTTAPKATAKKAPKKAAKATSKAAPKKASADAKEQVKEPAQEQAKPAESRTAASQPAESQTVLRVNGTTITRLELDRAVKIMLAQNQVQQPLPPETMKQAENDVLEQLTAAELLYQEASKLAVQDLDKQIAEKVAQNRSKFGSDADFEEALKGIDMTLKDMNDFTRKDIVINNFIEKQFSTKTAATEAEARKFYDENLEQYFKKPETAQASHILISIDEKASAEDRKKAKEKAEAILKRVKGGEDFAVLAKSDSSCPSSSQGGDLGTFTRGQMVPAFESATFALKPGEVSGVVETQFGYHIIKLTSKQEAATEKFENVKEKITEVLKREKVQQELSTFIDGLKKSAKIEKL